MGRREKAISSRHQPTGFGAGSSEEQVSEVSHEHRDTKAIPIASKAGAASQHSTTGLAKGIC